MAVASLIISFAALAGTACNVYCALRLYKAAARRAREVDARIERLLGQPPTSVRR